MGNKQSSVRFLGSKTEDEASEAQDHPCAFLYARQNYHNARNGDTYSSNFSERLRKIFSLRSLLYNALKRIVQKFRLSHPKPKNSAEPILPVVDPTPSIINEPLLVETRVITSPDSDWCADSSRAGGSAPFVPPPYSNPDNSAVSSQRWPEDDYSYSTVQFDHVIISIPNFRNSNSDTNVTEEVIDSAVIIEELSPQNVARLEESSGGELLRTKGEEEREEEKVVVKNVVVNEAKWIKHYSSHHRILLVGEGDFSFSACLAVAFCQAPYMVATSLDSKEFLKKNYVKAPSNIEKLRSRGSKVMHGIDATKMASNALLGLMTYDRIIYNFPFAGFFKDLSRKSQLRRHRRLVSLFLKNAKEMISEDGEIHITHKTNEFHNEWKLELVASSHRLRLIEAVPFHLHDYPGYNTKCGFGGDNNFNCNPSKTYKFGHKTVRY